MENIAEMVGTIFYAYAEVTFYGSGYRLKIRTFDSYDDAKGCMMMYIHNGGLTTTLTEWKGGKLDRSEVLRQVRRAYKAEEKILTGQYSMGVDEGYDFHKDSFLKDECMSPADINDFNKISKFIDKGYDTAQLNDNYRIGMKRSSKDIKDEDCAVIEILAPDPETLKMAMDAIKKSTDFIVVED